MARQFAGSPEKGWARDGILSVLLEKPASLSEIARGVGISKSTASYHMKELVNRGIAEIIDVKNVKGGVYTKTFSLRQGAVVISEPRNSIRNVDGMVAEQFDGLKLNWSLKHRPEDIILFLYHMFISLGGAQREQIGKTFFRYGKQFGREVLAPSLQPGKREQEVKEILAWLSRWNLAVCKIETSRQSEQTISCSNFFQSTDSNSPVFQFLAGIIEGALASKHGDRYLVGEGDAYGTTPQLLITRRRFSDVSGSSRAP
jgi:DNA-binding transcriptional ArsR family regulator